MIGVERCKRETTGDCGDDTGVLLAPSTQEKRKLLRIGLCATEADQAWHRFSAITDML